MQTLNNRIIETLIEPAKARSIKDLAVGIKAVGVQLDNEMCGLAYRFAKSDAYIASSLDIGSFIGRSAAELLRWLASDEALYRSLGLAVANALLQPSLLSKIQSEKTEGGSNILEGDVLSVVELRSDDRVGMIGYFEPTAAKISECCRIDIYEFDTTLAPGLLPSSEAHEGLKKCSVALITGTTIISDTIDRLLEASAGCREVVVLGPSTPLLPRLFDGTPVTLISGVTKISHSILEMIKEGGSMRQFLPFVSKVNLRVR